MVVTVCGSILDTNNSPRVATDTGKGVTGLAFLEEKGTSRPGNSHDMHRGNMGH